MELKIKIFIESNNGDSFCISIDKVKQKFLDEFFKYTVNIVNRRLKNGKHN